MDPVANAVAYPVSTIVGAASFSASLLVLGYRWRGAPWIRRALDRWQRRVTGRPDWRWLGLRHLLAGLVLVTAANVAFQVLTLHCSDDSLAILASGQAALHGHDPFRVTFCGGSTPGEIPYGTAEVALNALGALSGTVLGMWLVWQLLALAVVPLVWSVAGEDRRYVSVLAATSVLYLPNIATNIGVENSVVPVSVLLMLYAVGPARGRTRWLLQAGAAFLSTARFPALFGLLGGAAGGGTTRARRLGSLVVVVGGFLGAVAASYFLWGWDAIGVVYLDQFQRRPDESLNLFALLLRTGWVRPSLATAAAQGAVLLALVAFGHVRGYSARTAAALPLIGVMATSQYLTFHFVLWLVPLVLLGPAVNFELYVYGVLAWADETVLVGYLGPVQGVWWPYEVAGVILFALLVAVFLTVVRNEEARLRARAGSPADRGGRPQPDLDPTERQDRASPQ